MTALGNGTRRNIGAFSRRTTPPSCQGKADRTSYLSSVGEQAAEMYEQLMSRHNNSKEVQKLPHLERVRELQSHHHEVEEIIRHDLILQPVPEE